MRPAEFGGIATTSIKIESEIKMALLDVASSDAIRAEKVLDKLGVSEADMDVDDLMEIVLSAFQDQRELDAKIALEPHKYWENAAPAPSGSAEEAYRQGCRAASETITKPSLSEDAI